MHFLLFWRLENSSAKMLASGEDHAAVSMVRQEASHREKAAGILLRSLCLLQSQQLHHGEPTCDLIKAHFMTSSNAHL